jgi:hypothetical protein
LHHTLETVELNNIRYEYDWTLNQPWVISAAAVASATFLVFNVAPYSFLKFTI